MENLVPLQIHSHIILKILHALENEPIKTRILFQQIAFLILRKYKELFQQVDFKAHKFGPHSAFLGETLEELENLNYVSEDRELGIKITEEGEYFLTELEQTLGCDNSQKLKKSVEFMKKDFRDFSKDEILALIYKQFPDYIGNSIISDTIDYQKQFLKLYEEGKLGISKIAGIFYDIEVIRLAGYLDNEGYEKYIYLKKIRNRIIHHGIRTDENEAEKSLNLSIKVVKEVLNL